MRKLTWIRLIAILYCIVVIPALSIVYGINYGKYNQTILLLSIIGLDVFLTYQIISLFNFSNGDTSNKNRIKIERKIERPLKIVDKKVNCNIIEMVKDRYYDIEYKNKKYLFKKSSERVIDIYEVLE